MFKISLDIYMFTNAVVSMHAHNMEGMGYVVEKERRWSTQAGHNMEGMGHVAEKEGRWPTPVSTFSFSHFPSFSAAWSMPSTG